MAGAILAIQNYIKHLVVLQDVSFDIEHSVPPERYAPDVSVKYKFGSKEAAQPMYDNMNIEASKENLKFNLDKIEITPNTILSHILIKLAFKKNVGYEVLKEIFAAYFCKGMNIGDINS